MRLLETCASGGLGVAVGYQRLPGAPSAMPPAPGLGRRPRQRHPGAPADRAEVTPLSGGGSIVGTYDARNLVRRPHSNHDFAGIVVFAAALWI